MTQWNGMRPEILQNLADIVAAGNEIILLGGLDGEYYRSSRRDALAIERLFEIAGEALIRIRDQDMAVFESITSAPQIVGFRNVLAHGYDQVDPERVVAIIRNWLPQLIEDVRNLAPGKL